MLKVASPSSTVGFTSLSASTHSTISTRLETVISSSSSSSNKPPCKFFVSQDPILSYLSSTSPPTPLSKVCLLDPKAPKALSPSDAKEFDFFLFGGILGDDPPRDRTGELRRMGFEGRHLRDVQMTTDTALHVTKIVVEDKSECSQAVRRPIVLSDFRLVPLEEIKYVDYPTISFNAQESVEMPFRTSRPLPLVCSV
jgi:ribosome biogenesis SPOUT family RNA methylase Rps3